MSEGPQARQRSILYGVMLVSGGAIGAGMFSLPIVSAGMWFGWTVVCFLAVWALSYVGSLLLLEATLLYPRGASFNTVVKGILGPMWNIANGIGVAFLMYILIYAYLSAGGNIVNHTVASVTGVESSLPQNVSSLLFGFAIAFLVWIGTAVVSGICVVLMSAMLLTFLMFNGGLALHVEVVTLLDLEAETNSYFPYAWSALPYILTSFGFSGLVPSLVKFYGHEPAKIRSCLLYGTLICLALYLLWMLVIFGTLSRASLAPVIQAGGNMGDLVGALQGVNAHDDLSLLLGIFSNFAIASSFLGVGLCLFDYVADGLGFKDDALGRAKSALVTFLPPAIVCFVFPHGFILAIGYAGLVMIFSYLIVPVRMALEIRSSQLPTVYRIKSGSGVIYAVLAFSLLIGLCEILATIGVLPVYP